MAGRLSKLLEVDQATVIPYEKFIAECKRVLLIKHEGLPPLPDNKDRSGIRNGLDRDRKLVTFSEVDGITVEAELVLSRYYVEATVKIDQGLARFMGGALHEYARYYMVEPDGDLERSELEGDFGGLGVSAYRYGNGHPPFIQVDLNNVQEIRVFFERLYGLPVDAEFPPSRAPKRGRHE